MFPQDSLEPLLLKTCQHISKFTWYSCLVSVGGRRVGLAQIDGRNVGGGWTGGRAPSRWVVCVRYPTGPVSSFTSLPGPQVPHNISMVLWVGHQSVCQYAPGKGEFEGFGRPKARGWRRPRPIPPLYKPTQTPGITENFHGTLGRPPLDLPMLAWEGRVSTLGAAESQAPGFPHRQHVRKSIGGHLKVP